MNDKEYILCEDVINKAHAKFIEMGWITVSDDGIHSALVNDEKTDDSLKGYQWDYTRSEGFPTISEHDDGSFEYYRNEDGLEQFAIYRERTGRHDNYVELSEEFRLFSGMHERYVSEICKEYVVDDDNGNEDVVARIDGLSIQIKAKVLRAYLAARRINLLVFYDIMRYSKQTFVELGLTPVLNKIEKGDDFIYNYTSLVNCFSDGNKSGGWIMGKCLLRYDKKDFDAKAYPFVPKDQYEEFIIGYDENGDEKKWTCEESKLSNYFRDNNGVPQATTPVFFRKSVLDKYYGNPNKYEVNDGCVICDGAWSLRIDNDQREYAVVILKDLGHLPHEEQMYWKGYNVAIAPNTGLSETQYQRWYVENFCDPTYPDLVFKQRLRNFCEEWEKKMGWLLLLPLEKGDEHRLKTLHCLTQEVNDNDFEDQVLSLTKILIDSLNEKELVAHTDEHNADVTARLAELKASDLKSVKGGISKFELFLLSEGKKCSQLTEYMRSLQELRSTTTAHRKSSKGKAKCVDYFHLESKSQQEVSEDILRMAVKTINTLKTMFL